MYLFSEWLLRGTDSETLTSTKVCLFSLHGFARHAMLICSSSRWFDMFVSLKARYLSSWLSSSALPNLPFYRCFCINKLPGWRPALFKTCSCYFWTYCYNSCLMSVYFFLQNTPDRAAWKKILKNDTSFWHGNKITIHSIMHHKDYATFKNCGDLNRKITFFKIINRKLKSHLMGCLNRGHTVLWVESELNGILQNKSKISTLCNRIATARSLKWCWKSA